MVAQIRIPPLSDSDWHLNLRLSLQGDKTRLYAFTYAFSKSRRLPSHQLFVPRTMERPESDWDAIQTLAYGVDLLASRR